MDASNFMLGHYVKIAIHAPKKYPKQPVAMKEDEEADGSEMTAADEAKINALMGAFAKKAKNLPTVGAEPLETGNTEATGQ